MFAGSEKSTDRSSRGFGTSVGIWEYIDKAKREKIDTNVYFINRIIFLL